MFCYTHLFKCFKCLCMCFKRMLQVFQLFQKYIVIILSKYFKSRSGCYTCCNVPQLPKPPAVVARASCMRMGSKGIEHCSVAGTDTEGDGGRGVGGPCVHASCRGEAQAQ
jgi:hypothetical protein